MAVTLLTSSGFTWGVSSAETGIGVESVDCNVEPEFRESRHDKDNTINGWAIAPAKLEIDIDGEVGGATGIMAAVFTAALTVANTITSFGAPSTSLYPTSANITQNRAGWKKVKVKCMANAGVA